MPVFMAHLILRSIATLITSLSGCLTRMVDGSISQSVRALVRFSVPVLKVGSKLQPVILMLAV
ncbi:MAG: hypothetical protein A3J49_17845 [Gallionellales bacterium RIFCSPHIGHO2_02_FULL_57_16]|nr:MAG: hypothetical protein A3J49_17845 [Gallionellales bacterium RIFCSPHIGHO2_02_FULL_57_16]